MRSRQRWMCGILWSGMVLATGLRPVCARADELATYFERLRERGLFQVAEQAALSRLDDAKLAPARRTDLLVELSRTLMQHATVASPANQAELWEQAVRVVQEGANAQPAPVHRELLLAQAAIVLAERATYARREAETTPWDSTTLKDARQACERALTAVRSLIAQSSGETGRRTVNELTPVELRAYQQTLQLIEGTVFRDRARLGTAGTAERASDIVDALQSLRAAQVGLVEERRLWALKLVLADLTRLQGDAVRCEEMLKVLWKSVETLSPEQRSALAAARIELWIERGEPLAAAEFFLEESRAVPQLAGEIGLAQVRTLLLLQQTARVRQDLPLAKELRTEAETLTGRLAREVGNPWHRWASRLLEGDVQQSQFGPELLASVRKGDAERQRGDFAAAAQSYAAAVQLAQSQGSTGIVADLRYTRGSILLDAKDYATAAEEFAKIGQLEPPVERSAAADLLATFALGKLYEEQRTKTRREAYVTALEQHLLRFESSPTAADAHWMLAQLEEQRLQASIALPHYEAIPINHPRYSAALCGAVRCREALYQRLLTLGRPVNDSHRETAEWFAATVAKFPADQPWSAEQGEVVLGAIRWQLRGTPPNYRGAEAALQRFMTAEWETTAAVQAVREAAVPLQLTTWAGVGRSREALALIEKLPQSPPDPLLAVVLGLDQLAQVPQENLSFDFSSLFLAAVKRLLPEREKLPPAAQSQFDSARLRCLLIADQDQDAANLAVQIEQTLGDEPTRWERFGQQLEERPRRALAPVAQRVWRKIESHRKAGTPEWLAARTAVIRQTVLIPDPLEAAKLLKLTRVLYGRIADAATRAEWDRLERSFSAK